MDVVACNIMLNTHMHKVLHVHINDIQKTDTERVFYIIYTISLKKNQNNSKKLKKKIPKCKIELKSET